MNNAHAVDYQFHFASLHIGDDYKADFYDVTTFPTTDGFTILPTLLKPKSRGEVILAKDNTNNGLVIDPRFCTHDDDKALLIEVGQLAYDVITSEPFKPHFKQMMLPKSKDPETIWLHAKRQMETVYHPVGTCKMGIDPDAVVNPSLHVIGVGKLMVADASIMPTIVAGNTNAACIMIGEKAAKQLIRD
jgi:choline dehydrogenase